MQTAAVAQRQMFTIRFSEEEKARLDLLAKHYGLTAAGVLRMLLKREVDALRSAVEAEIQRREVERGAPLRTGRSTKGKGKK
jgi:predicted DNA-binding protein